MAALVAKLRLLIADNHALVRIGLRAVFSDDPGLEVVAEATGAAGVLPEIERSRPDVVLLEVRFEDGDGLEVCRRIKSAFPEVKVVFLSSSAADDLVVRAVQAGADGYLLKTSTEVDLPAAIRNVAAGGAMLDPIVTRRMLARLRTSLMEGIDGPISGPGASGSSSTFGASRGSGHPRLGLTAREEVLLDLLSCGKTNKEIAEALRLTEGTVKNALMNVFQKLGVGRRTQAVAWFLARR